MLVDTLRFLTAAAWVVAGIIAVAVFIFSLRYGLRVALSRIFSARLLLPLLIALVITFSTYALVFVRPQEVGVVVSLLWPEGYRNQPFRSGLHLIVPLAETVVIYPISWNTYTMSAQTLEGSLRGNDGISARTSDGQEIILDCSTIYRVQPENAIRVHIEWQQRYESDFIRPLLRSTIRTAVSQYTVDEVNSSKRLQLETELENEVRGILEEKGFALDRFLLRSITFSPEYASAVERKQVAMQEQILREYEAEQLRRYAKGEADAKSILAAGNSRSFEIEAQGRAAAILLEGQAQADVLKVTSRVLGTNKLLVDYAYVQKLSPAIKAMLLPSNAPVILPLSDLLSDTPATPAGSALTMTATLTPTLAPLPMPTAPISVPVAP
jgi:regulator of protease activity HflC (stomatin/prohibitin superfamily)